MTNQKNILSELALLRSTLLSRQETAIGIPVNLAANYQAISSSLSDIYLNNIGDVFIERKGSFSTQKYEKKVLEFFAKLYALKEDEWWGYTTAGSTESNLSGLWLARERYPKACLYYSADSHYSISKLARILNLKSRMISSYDNGEINYELFNQAMCLCPGQPVIINLNIGTTMKGAIDNIENIITILHDHQIEEYHIHCDAALFGGFLPFLDPHPLIDFTLPIHSLAISGYKFIGSPFPCGIVLTRKKFIKPIKSDVEYIDSMDTTVMGSRNGHAPMILWHAINTRGYAGLQKEAQVCIRNAQKFYAKLLALSYPCLLNPYSNIIFFKKPSAALVSKWRLMSEGEWSHIVVMQHVTEEKLHLFIRELTQSECL